MLRALADLVRLSLLFLALACSAPGPATLSRADVSTEIGLLASDAMEGRRTGTEGGVRSAQAVAAAFEEAGLRPGGDGGTFLQAIGWKGHVLTGPIDLRLVHDDGLHEPLVHGVDYVYLRGAPVQGAFELQVARGPDDLPERADPLAALALVGRPSQTMGWLEQAGMAGGHGWGALLLVLDRDAGSPRAPPDHVLGRVGDPPILLLLGQAAEAVSGGAVDRVQLGVRVGPGVPAYNVVGLLPGVGTGAHPELADEVVVLSAHHDHLGVGAPAEGMPGADPDDVIYNGADDDASGVVALIELAQAFAAGPPPARTLVFLAVTGEEEGLLGTGFYLDHPARPLERTVADVNFEMIGRPDPAVGGAGVLWLTGYDRTNLGPAFTAAGLPVVADPHPEQHFFERSDNIAFVQRGIVGVTLSSYGLHDDYHRPSDEPDTLDYAHLTGAIRVAFRAVKLLADGSLDPRWTEEPGEPAAPADGSASAP